MKIAGSNFDHFHMGDLLRYACLHIESSLAISGVARRWERSENAYGGTADMYVSGKSDDFVVPTKWANKAGTQYMVWLVL